MNFSFPPRRVYTLPLPGGRVLRLGDRPLVMGVLNVTPDSFAEATVRIDPDVAVDAAVQMEGEGADLIDVGGESSRPGAEPVGVEAEMARVMPVLRRLSGRLRIPISIDTCKAEVARRALSEGAVVVNDISGLGHDPELGRVVAGAGAGLILMHMRGRPTRMYAAAHYDDVMGEVAAELRTSVEAAIAAGVDVSRVIVDPGIGFAKRPADSYGVLSRLPELASALDRPILAGPSRKSFMREALSERPAIERDWGTAAAVTAAVLGGAHIVRVHNVAAMVQVARVAEAVRLQNSELGIQH